MMSLAALEDVIDSTPGTEEVRRYSHFEITLAADGSLAELGHGAMGTTYRALDTVLKTPVALKIIGRNVADSPAVRARFLREARAAARLRHPNIASVFHYGEQEGECFYVMELVEGETLEARIRRDGPLPAGPALEVAAQITHALAAAEAREIVHRDLKPSNIMLSVAVPAGTTESPSIKVIDFGLAKAIAPDSDVPGIGDTRDGFVGTPAFASPEQFARANDERIDTRSDIYSLGVTLWYLLCGKMPFVGKTLTEVHEQQTRLPLPLEQLRAAHVPAPVAALLRSMLAVAPVARPQSTRELLEALHRCQRQLLRASLTRYASLAAALGLAALVILALALWRERTRPLPPPPDRSLGVLPFENLSPDPADVFFTTGVHDEIVNDLAHLPELTVIGSDTAGEHPAGKPRDLAAIGRELRVGHLLEGSCKREGQRMAIKLRLVDLGDPSHPWVQQYDRPLADIFAVQGEIARAVLDQLRISPSDAEKAIINRPPTHDLVAYELFLRSNEGPNFIHDQTADRHDGERRIALLEQAVARDPGFMLAYCKLAVEHDYAWDDRAGATAEELSVDHRTLAEAALQKARSLQPDAGEVHLALAEHLRIIDDVSGQALIEANLAQRAWPNKAIAHDIAGSVDCQYGRWDDAVRSFERAVALNPHSEDYAHDLATTYEALGRYADFDRMMAITISLAPEEEKFASRLERANGVVEQRADLAPLRSILSESPENQDAEPERRSYHFFLKLCERDAEGLRHLLAAHDEPGDDPSERYPAAWFEAVAAKMRGDEAAARTAFTAARLVKERAFAQRPTSGEYLSDLAVIDAGLGRKDDALREARRACEMLPYETAAEVAPVIYCNLAVVYAWTGEPDLAIATLTEVVKHPSGNNLLSQPTYGDFRLNPVWDPLRQDPRFEVLVSQLAPKSPR